MSSEFSAAVGSTGVSVSAVDRHQTPEHRITDQLNDLIDLLLLVGLDHVVDDDAQLGEWLELLDHHRLDIDDLQRLLDRLKPNQHTPAKIAQLIQRDTITRMLPGGLGLGELLGESPF